MIVLTTLLTSTVDPQRGVKWECDPKLVETLAHSVDRHGYRLVILHDEDPISEPTFGEWARVERKHPNVYFDRWFQYRDHLRQLIGPDPMHGWEGEAWLVDATDVEMLQKPAPPRDDGQIWQVCVGSEMQFVGNEWLWNLHPSVRPFIEANAKNLLLNAGLVGGDRANLADLASDIADRLGTADGDSTDMGVFNEVLGERLDDIQTGPPVHTVFKAFDHDNETCWWRHK